jgi:uncharacterized RDD family membrane protein YckC
MNYAGFWIRFVAYFIDSIVLGIVQIILAFLFGTLFGTGGNSGVRQVAASIINVLVLVIAWFYFAYQESSSKQATLGKQAMGIVVTDFNGQPISFSRATFRYFSKILSGVILLIGFIMAAFTEKKQALHDIIAGTLVLKK